jgi:hypothetical protein
MSCVIREETLLVDLWHSLATIQNSCKIGEDFPKKEYVSRLLQPDENEDYENTLFQLSLETLQELCLSLGNVFTDKCSNDQRVKMIQSLLKVDQNQWRTLLQQVCFIMPVGTPGHDVMWATEILSSITDFSDRERIAIAANRLFKPETLTVERGYILDAVAKLDSEERAVLDRADEEARTKFVNGCVSEFVKREDETLYSSYRIQQKGWKV